jgi:hypothetical protein
VDVIGLLETVYGLIVDSEILITQALVEVDLPVGLIQVKALLKHLDCCLVPAQEIERTPELLQVVDVSRVK